MIKIMCTECNCEAEVVSYVRKEPKKLVVNYICPSCGESKSVNEFLYEKADIDTKSKELLKFINTNLNYLKQKRKDVQSDYDCSDNILDNIKQTIHLERVKSGITTLNQIKLILENKY